VIFDHNVEDNRHVLEVYVAGFKHNFAVYLSELPTLYKRTKIVRTHTDIFQDNTETKQKTGNYINPQKRQ